MRVPWCGGARRVAIERLFPVIFTFLFFVIAAQGWTPMTFSFIILILFITFPQEKYFCLSVNMFFHAQIFYSCIAIVVIVYEHYVVPQLEISFSENMIFVVLLVIAGLTLCAIHLRRLGYNTGQVPELPSLSKHCPTCNLGSHLADFHSIWYGCCIGIHNRVWYTASVGALMGALFDCSYLTLTTVCRPYELVEDLIVIPEQCDEVFIQWQYAICFVSGVFSLVFSMILLLLFLRELWFISIGFTITEWRKLPTCQKLILGLFSKRPYNRGFIRNWLQVFKRSYI